MFVYSITLGTKNSPFWTLGAIFCNSSRLFSSVIVSDRRICVPSKGCDIGSIESVSTDCIWSMRCKISVIRLSTSSISSLVILILANCATLLTSDLSKAIKGTPSVRIYAAISASIEKSEHCPHTLRFLKCLEIKFSIDYT